MKLWIAALAGIMAAAPAAAQDDKPMQPMTETPPAPSPAKQPPKEDPPAQTENLPEAESLFEKHIAAVGGAEAVKAERNRLVKAKYAVAGGVEGSLRIMRVAPDKLAQVLEIPGMLTQELWCDGESAWIRDSNKGTSRLKGAELADTRRLADIAGECNYKARYREVKTVGREKFADAEVYAVKATPAEGKPRTLYFDAQSGFMIGIRIAGEAGPESDAVTVLSDYKKFGSVSQPTKSITKRGETVLGTVTIQQIDSNLSVLPSVAPPDEVREVK